MNHKEREILYFILYILREGLRFYFYEIKIFCFYESITRIDIFHVIFNEDHGKKAR